MVFGLVAAVVLVAGYAAVSRFDRISGPPEPTLNVTQSSPDAPDADATSQPADTTSSKSERSQETDALTHTVRALIKAEKALSPPSSSPVTAPHVPSPLVLNVVGDSSRPSGTSPRPSTYAPNTNQSLATQTPDISSSESGYAPSTIAGASYPTDSYAPSDTGLNAPAIRLEKRAPSPTVHIGGPGNTSLPTQDPTTASSETNIGNVDTTETTIGNVDTTITTQAMAKVAEADALLGELGQTGLLSQPAASQAQLQQRKSRINTLRSQLSDLNSPVENSGSNP